ncbi:MAG TPA: sugar phosphate nucleotidyltransferase [Candidatus Saccharimonadaceae bacterium]|nr:sugar phosphate nucleotidyltransferase [Candidatus Saccharimonadaceae bacterium]
MIEVEKKDADKYGMAMLADDMGGNLFRLGGLVEKPGEEKTPSQFASVGSYLLTPEIWEYLEKEEVGVGGEISLPDSLNQLAASGEVYGQFIEGVWHDTGDQLKYIKAVIDLALESDVYGDQLRDFLRKRLG